MPNLDSLTIKNENFINKLYEDIEKKTKFEHLRHLSFKIKDSSISEDHYNLLKNFLEKFIPSGNLESIYLKIKLSSIQIV